MWLHRPPVEYGQAGRVETGADGCVFTGADCAARGRRSQAGARKKGSKGSQVSGRTGLTGGRVRGLVVHDPPNGIAFCVRRSPGLEETVDLDGMDLAAEDAGPANLARRAGRGERIQLRWRRLSRRAQGALLPRPLNQPFRDRRRWRESRRGCAGQNAATHHGRTASQTRLAGERAAAAGNGRQCRARGKRGRLRGGHTAVLRRERN